MNYRLLSRMLGVICVLLAVSMLFSLPWAHPSLGWRFGLPTPQQFEWRGFFGIVASCVTCSAIGAAFLLFSRNATGQLYRKEAMATVGLSWILATALGGLPYLFSGTLREPEVPMNFADALFEAQSGFSTTGASVLTNVEDPQLVPHCVLFWRASTHFLGGLGIVVLLVALLGQGSAGKSMLRAEVTGPTKDGTHNRVQQTAWAFAIIYCGLTAMLVLIYILLGMSPFDATCHAFGTMATGGFSNYNVSLGSFHSPAIEYVSVLFMILAGTNFSLLYLFLTGRIIKGLKDVEWQVYLAIIGGATGLVILFGMLRGDFSDYSSALRLALFQVVSIMTTTGYATCDFDQWNNFGRGILLLLMFVGGCAGSTAGGMKVIRHVLFAKIAGQELELAYRPRVVRPLRLGDQVLDDVELRKNILVFFGLVAAIFTASWLVLIMIEPDRQWLSASGGNLTNHLDHKLLDCASAVSATLHNVGPGLGVAGPMVNYANFATGSKLLFVFLMVLGRLELFSILVLFLPGFWRKL